ncbi:hypothetical protein G7046_g5015 [Stylonectria norvegica]|nr:hypothetical protein G7046_g5015 [Stylonectria norvegica]
MHGYSSSEESDDPRRPQEAPPSNDDKKKEKKKKKLPPQQSINRIWKKFSKRKFHKALAVLPFDPVLPPAVPNQPNELLSAGYDRAADECRKKVEKIVKECRRLNLRYRDPGWDLDLDLNHSRGYCLNRLNKKRFDISKDALLDPESIVPKAVKRVHEIFEKPTFMRDINLAEVKQGHLGDCWFMSSLTALTSVKDGIKRMCVAYDTKIGIYGFVFYRDGEWIYSIIDDQLYLKNPSWDSRSAQREILQQTDREDAESEYRKTFQTGSRALFFAQCKDQNETWVPLLEKAYAKAHGDYASLHGGWVGEGLEDLSGGVTTELLSSDILDTDAFWDNEMSKVNQEFMFGTATGLLDDGYGDRNGIYEKHAYVVMDAKTLKSGQRLVKLRNPWGKVSKGIWQGAWSDGSKEWTREAQEEIDHKFGIDAVFWITYEEMIRKYANFDRTRLFRDPDWRCCQRWIGVDVPWKAHYHEKFQIKLTKDSPLVLVLSQLDGRYFQGLLGQYYFQLHFRLHHQDQPNAEDYIVRSHGNHFMHRSVSVELPDMAAGTYVVYLKVTGVRDIEKTSVEDVVKEACSPRADHTKFAQVGQAYDLAHSKAWDHMDKVAKLRKKMDQKKASGYRQEERRRQWDKRHVLRDVKTKQGKKNKDKKERRRQAWEAEQAKLNKEYEEKNKEQTEETKTKEVESPEIETKMPDSKKPEIKEIGSKTLDTKETESKKIESEEAGTETTEAKKSEAKTPETKTPETKASETKEPEPKKIEYKETETKGAKSEANVVSDEVSSSNNKVPDDKSPEKPVEGKGGNEKPCDESVSNLKQSGTKATDDEEGKLAIEKADQGNKPTDEAKLDGKTEQKPSDDSNASISIGSPLDTPKSEDLSVEPSKERKQDVPPIDGPPPSPPPPPAVAEKQKSTRQRPDYDSSADSSDTPIEDWEEVYSSDDMTRNPKVPKNYPPLRDETDSEEETLPDPWNAICIVGIRVYSKDEGLELRTVMEGGELLEGGMGEKGATDLDDAQTNAGGVRLEEKKQDAADTDKGSYPSIIRKDGGDVDVEDNPEKRNLEIRKYIHVDSTDSTEINTPEQTPLESDKRLERMQ